MAQAIYQTISTSTNSGDGLVLPDWQQSPFNLSYAVLLVGAATATFTVQYTLDDINNAAITPIWVADPTNGSAQTANAGGSYSFPIRGLRVNVSALSGTLRLAVIQGSSAR